MVTGAGIGYRPKLAAALVRRPGRIDFLEVVAESCRDVAVRREVVALSRVWPVVLHSIGVSPGGAEGVDRARVDWLADLARELGARLVSEHMAFVRAGGREIGHLTELPRTRAAIAVLARNVATIRRRLPDVPFLLENPARAFVWPHHEMSEATFLHEVTMATGCPLLLDVANLHANARNGEATNLDELPLDRVALVHVAGGSPGGGYHYDTHAHPVAEEVFALAARTGAPLLLERDDALDDPEPILAEVDRLRALAGARDVAMRPTMTLAPDASLVAEQRELARLLLNDEPAPRLDVARNILKRKQRAHERPVRSLAVEHGTGSVVSRLLRRALRGRDRDCPHHLESALFAADAAAPR